jgi:hypothetical protein
LDPVTNETEAASTLLSVYKRVGLERRPQDIASTCNVGFTTTKRRIDYSVFYSVENGALNIELHDTDIDTGTIRMMARFLDLSMRKGSRLRVRPWFLPMLVSLVLCLLEAAIYLHYGYGEIGTVSAILVLAVISSLAILVSLLVRRADKVFVEKLVSATSLDEARIRAVYGRHTVEGPPMYWFLLLDAYLILLAVMSFLMFPLVGTGV